MILYSNFYENLTKTNSYNGLIAKIANASYMDMSDGVYLSPGFITNVAIGRFFEIFLQRPYSQCDIPNDFRQTGTFSYLFDLILISQYHYSQELCLDLCYQQDIIKTCRCNPYFYPFFNDTVICQTNNDTTCINERTQIFLEKNILIATCLPLCPLECNRTHFSTSTSFSRLNGDQFITSIENNSNLARDFVTKKINAHNVMNSIVSVNFYYESLSYTMSIEEPSCDWICMIANVGGFVVFFMGACLLSVGELIECLIEFYFICKEN